MAKTQKKDRRKRTSFNILNMRNTKHSQFNFGEVYRHIRTNIEFSTVDKEIHTLCVTSTQPYEAKTTTALNLAIVFAIKYSKVLLIDCDLRKPQIHKYLKLSNKAGLSNALLDFAKSGEIGNEYIQSVSDNSFVEKLHVMTSGMRIPNPAEMLSSDAFKNFLEKLREDYDYVIIDCPPVTSVSDAIPIGRIVDGTIFVCSSQDTNRKDAQAALDVLLQNNVHVLGSVLTKADTYSHGYGYYYYY